MTIGLFIKQALESIRANKMRSFLSLLGIVIGISSFVVMLAIGEWAKASIAKDFSANKDVITVSGWWWNVYGYMKSSQSSKGSNQQHNIMTEEIASLVPHKVPGVKEVRKVYNGDYKQWSYKNKRIDISLQATTPGYIDFLGGKLLYWSMFGAGDYLSGTNHLVLGHGLVYKIFKSDNPLGKELRIGWDIFVVVGTLAKKDRQVDQTAFVPIATMKNINPKTKISSFKVVVHNKDTIEQTKKYLDYYLTKMAGAESKEKAGFNTRTDEEWLKQINSMMKKFSLLLGGIGAIALVVWGIGIMNIMLVSVTERTREIGIKKAIGATNRMIMLQFLIESVILTLLGSLIAIGFSYGVTALLAKVMPDFKPLINVMVVLLAVCVATAMGIVFGLMPARKAAKLKVIDALHFE